ncbi:endonuclease/exonuclease/phosphatase family protein [Micromonospora sp. CA-249363]|uniref:endonuclease/exonuclease/phosphatase family protein n=1 Tax=Micromonospora sp. CA-249363 TaxID=3239963 RepID=UPI003D925654
MRQLLALATAVLTATSVLLSPARPALAASDGTVTVAAVSVTIGSDIRFSYTTPRPTATNWVGLYADPGNGPVQEKYVGPSTTWVYTPSASGSGTLPTAGLTPGTYILYYLYNDGYTWLAQPVPIRLTATGAPHFPTAAFTLRNAKVGTAYSATVGGLVRGDTSGLTVAKTSGPSWATVSATGAITGTPPTAGTTTLGLRATTAAGTTTATVTIRVQSGALVPQLRALSWNLWHGGTAVSNGLEKELTFLLEGDVDVVGIQENEGGAARTLAAALGWSYFQDADTAVLSRYPITATTPTVAGSAVAATINLGSRSLRLWSAHLGYTPYGPYDACFGRLSVQQLISREASSGRTGQINSILTAMKADLAASATTPVLLTGDFNAPSHLDWTATNSRCGYGAVAWPTSTAPANAGMVDSYRQARPDPARDPGNTWSPVYKTFTGGYGYDSHRGDPEPQDRIDFIHYRGPLTVLSSDALWTGTPSQSKPSANAWSSDHAAVLTTFRVN